MRVRIGISQKTEAPADFGEAERHTVNSGGDIAPFWFLSDFLASME